jgi:hypothetical protein
MKVGGTYEFPYHDGRTDRYTVIRINGRLITTQNSTGARGVFSKGSQVHIKSVEASA